MSSRYSDEAMAKKRMAHRELFLKNSKAKSKLNRFLVSKNTKKYFNYLGSFI